MSASQPVYWPFDPALVTEEFGTRGGEHGGIDGGMPVGTPLIAAFDGIVSWVGNDGASGALHLGGGQWVEANGPALIVDVRRDDGLISRVAHLDGFAVTQGQRVSAGDVVGYSGNSGFSLGPHTHWETRWDSRLGPGSWVNPRSFDPQIFTTPDGQEEDEDMKLENRAVCHTKDGVQTVVIGERTSGWKFKYTTTATKGRNPENERWAAFFETGDFIAVTDRSMLDQWEASLDRMVQGK